MLRCTSSSALDSIKLVSNNLSERVRLDCTSSGECFEENYLISEDLPRSTDSERDKIYSTNDDVFCRNWSVSMKLLNTKSPSAERGLKHTSIGNLKAMTDMTMNSNLMFRSMFFMNDEATRHFLAPPLPPIQACDIQPDYLQKKLPQGPISPGTSSVTNSSTNTGQISTSANSSASSSQQHHQPLEKAVLAVPKQRPHNCEECGKTFLMKHHLSTHMRVHTGERPHVCPECGKSFALKHCLSTHLLLHTADRPYKCPECNKSFTLKHHLVSHERVHTRERPFECTECGQRFPQKRHLSTHIKFHSGERPFSCQVCGESFSREEHLVMHSRFHGGLSPYNCPDCGAGFLRKFELVNHERQHGRNPESCPTCGKEFLQKRTLLVHVRTCGVNTPASMSCRQASSPPRFSEGTPSRNDSSSPGYFFGTPSRFHNESDSQRFSENSNNQFRYSDGQTRFSDGMPSSASSSMSMQITKDKVCKECGETFASVEGLALHLRLHFGDHSFLADICSLAASLKQTAVNVAASLKKTHICTDCGRGFTQRHGLFQHRQRHSNGSCKEKPFACEKCGKSFAQKNHLTLHERQHMDHTRNSGMSKKGAGPCTSSEDSCMEAQHTAPSRDPVQSNQTILHHQNHADIHRVDLINRHSQDPSTSDNNQRSSQSENRKEIERVIASTMMLQQSHSDHQRAEIIVRLNQDSSPPGDSNQRTCHSEHRKDMEQAMASSIMLQHKQVESTSGDSIQRSSQCGSRTMYTGIQRVDLVNRHPQDSSQSENSQRTSQSDNQKELGHPMTDSIMIQQNHSDDQSADHLSAESHRPLNTSIPIALVRIHNNRVTQHHQPSPSEGMPCLHPVHNKQY